MITAPKNIVFTSKEVRGQTYCNMITFTLNVGNVLQNIVSSVYCNILMNM